MVSSISQRTGNGLFDMLRSVQKGQDEALEASASESLTTQIAATASQQTTPAHASSSNLMSKNFASAEREESKYMKARQAGQEAVTKQASRQMAILNAGLAELNGLSEKDSENYAIRSLIGRKAARRMQEEGQQTVREESERNLKEIKENIEERAQEAAAPKDENGNPIEGLPTENAGEAAPMPEISGSNPAPAPTSEVSAAPAPDVAAAPASEIATPTPAPSTPSIDIRV